MDADQIVFGIKEWVTMVGNLNRNTQKNMGDIKSELSLAQ